MAEFKNQWDVVMAMQVLIDPHVESRLWSEAVKWLLLYGPSEIRELIAQSSGFATNKCFPELKPEGFNAEGEPCYSLSELAAVLGMTDGEAKEKLADMGAAQQVQYLFGEDEVRKLQ